MAKIGVIGDRDAVLLFKAVGLDVFFEDDPGKVNQRVRKLAREGYEVLFISEKLFPACAETVKEFESEAYPAFVPIPDHTGASGVGMAALKQNVERAVGVDILFNNN